jgi:hypothetical protein
MQCYQVMGWDNHVYTRPDGKKDWGQGSNMASQTVENVKLDRATVQGIKSSPTSGFDTRIKFPANMFDSDALVRMGK